MTSGPPDPHTGRVERTGREANVFTVKMRNRGLPPRLVRAVGRFLARAMGFERFNAFYRGLTPCEPADFSRVLREAMGLRLSIEGEGFDNLPRTGPVIVVSDHSLGMIEFAAIEPELLSRRADVTTMISRHLAPIPDIRTRGIFVDPVQRRKDRADSRAGWRQAFRWLGAGHVMLVYPAGRVARFQLRKMAVVEQPWSHHIAGIARRLGVPVLPVHVAGRASAGLRIFGALAQAMQDVLVIREAAMLHGRAVRVRVGRLVEPDELARFATDKEATEFLRAEVEALKISGQPMQVRRMILQ